MSAPDERLHFGRLKISGFRRIREAEIDFTGRPLAVLIGANGSGKTSLLNVFRLLAASASGDLRSFLSDSGGIADILTRDKAKSLRVELATSGAKSRSYGLEITPQGAGHEIAHEALTEGGKTQVFFGRERLTPRLPWEKTTLETSLSQIPHTKESETAFRDWLASSDFFPALEVGKSSPIRLPQPIGPASLPRSNGEETVSTLYNLRESDPDRFELLEDTLRVVFPAFQRLGFPAVAAGRATLTWKEEGFERPFYIYELSEGTLRFLWMCAILMSQEPPAVLMIDEPEVSMHPRMLMILADLLQSASRWSQVVVATHSERLISYLKPEQILVADTEGGDVQFAWADKKTDLSRWLKDYSLGELWLMNVIGGRE